MHYCAYSWETKHGTQHCTTRHVYQTRLSLEKVFRCLLLADVGIKIKQLCCSISVANLCSHFWNSLCSMGGNFLVHFWRNNVKTITSRIVLPAVLFPPFSCLSVSQTMTFLGIYENKASFSVHAGESKAPTELSPTEQPLLIFLK